MGALYRRWRNTQRKLKTAKDASSTLNASSKLWRDSCRDRKTPKKVDRKRFVRYKEGAEMYSMCQSKFEDMAKDAGAVYKLNKLVLVNCDIFEQYLETFRLSD